MAARVVLNYTKLFYTLVFALIFYNEFLAYYSAVLNWPSLKLNRETSKNILFVADPQIQGYETEPQFPLGIITRWDSDRYLSKTFSWVLYYYKIDAIIFLGDLIDEGSITDEETYEVYVNRFDQIYPRNSAQFMFYISGDNDVGGENNDVITDEKLRRFSQHFNSKHHASWQVDGSLHMDFVWINLMTDSVSSLKTPEKNAPFRAIVSHLPLLAPRHGVPNTEMSESVLKMIQPDIIFSAHVHTGFHAMANRITGSVYHNVSLFSSRSNNIKTNLKKDKTNDVIHEIVVPTCSYRMGVKEMAFGLAQVDIESGDFHYYNLWLPSRFAMLYLYFFSLPFLSLLLCLARCNRSTRRRRISSRPLLTSLEYSRMFS